MSLESAVWRASGRKRLKASRKRQFRSAYWEKYKNKLFRSEVDGKIEDRIITGTLWNVDEMEYMVTTELIAGDDDDCGYDCINKMIRNLIYK